MAPGQGWDLSGCKKARASWGPLHQRRARRSTTSGLRVRALRGTRSTDWVPQGVAGTVASLQLLCVDAVHPLRQVPG